MAGGVSRFSVSVSERLRQLEAMPIPGVQIHSTFPPKLTRALPADWSVFYVSSACKDWTLARVRVRAVAWAMLGDPIVTNGRGNRFANFTRGQV